MIRDVHPDPGRGGQLALLVGVAALIVVIGAFAYDVIGISPASPPPPPNPGGIVAGTFQVGSAECPGATTASTANTCDIPAPLKKGVMRAVLNWDTSDPLTLELIDPAGRSVTTSSSSSSPVNLNATIAAGGAYTLRVIDVNRTGPIHFDVGFDQGS